MLKYAHDTLGPVLTDHMTSDLLTSVQHAGDGCYVDDFLGNSDMDFSNKSMASCYYFIALSQSAGGLFLCSPQKNSGGAYSRRFVCPCVHPSVNLCTIFVRAISQQLMTGIQ
ncbi:hypothetical protein DPMN_101033 [Dreissena polymorpha]|uniref:Uncharacterized protein n=1 Tax=Dreissena polymorpha TaxID=45954 RepID=A0A9D4LIC9_DREPO|nr:hypothetical protein DPMN_101033 [Dreissena polymorpha]